MSTRAERRWRAQRVLLPILVRGTRVLASVRLPKPSRAYRRARLAREVR